MSSQTNSIDLDKKSSVSYPEDSINLITKYKLSLEWVPKDTKTLLDAGCAWGYGTRILKQKCSHIYGIDPNQDAINVAKKRDERINFINCGLEKTPFESEFFDVVVCCETLEHVGNEIDSLNEIYRILKTRGILIITTPHKGLFGFMDPGNSIRWVDYFVKSKLPGLYRIAYKMRKGEYPQKVEVKKPIYDHDNTHRHYTLEDIFGMLDESIFREKYEMKRVLRSGCFVEPFTLNVEFYLTLFKVQKRMLDRLSKIFRSLSVVDYWIPYNKLAYNIAVKIIKKESI
ncbi:MAG: class I SAM-dependent methyltransferase [Hormoscilla sp. GM7CHS1pb]|nr:class I SAM-dependent methyltransferase [Hormoscilla sp. GM7CHS1pb]